MTNVIQFKTKRQLRNEQVSETIGRWDEEQTIRAQKHTIQCLKEVLAEMEDDLDKWTAQSMLNAETIKLEKMKSEYDLKYSK